MLKRLSGSRRRWLAAVVLLAALWGCGGPGEEELRDGARSLLPPESAIVKESPGDCVELAPSPSCVHIYFVATETRLERRITGVIKAATESDWVLDSRELLPGGTSLRFHRDDLKAIVSLKSEDQAEECALDRTLECADLVMVEGDYGV